MTNSFCKIILLFLLFSFLQHSTAADLYSHIPDQPVKEGIHKNTIHSVLLHREGWKLSYPVIELNGDAGLLLSFDDLTSTIQNYSYRIIHCDHSWTPSSITEYEYIEGLMENQILDYSFSFNTNISYVHYKLKLPNEDLRIKISGNYALVVYEDFDPEKLVFIKRFIVAEKIATVEAFVKRPMLTDYRNNGQEIDFRVQHGNYSIRDPYSEINIKILQNGRWDNAITNLKPLFIRHGIMEYDYERENIFPGGSEFRWFDIRSTRYQSPYIKNVTYHANMFHVELFPDEIRSGKVYFFDNDLNGKYYVEVQEQTNNDTDADYVMVHFNLPYEAPLVHGKFYIHGALSNWVFSEINEMRYNLEKKSYEGVMLLKQGYYNYQYAFVPDGSSVGDLSLTEGNYYETENDYIILVYHRPLNSRYDRLIGHQIINSLHK